MTPAISELGVSRHGQHKPSHYIRSPQGPLMLGAPDLPGCRARGRAARGAAQVSRCPALAAPRAPHGGARREGRCTASPAQARARRGHRLPRPPFPTRAGGRGGLTGWRAWWHPPGLSQWGRACPSHTVLLLRAARSWEPSPCPPRDPRAAPPGPGLPRGPVAAQRGRSPGRRLGQDTVSRRAGPAERAGPAGTCF